MARPVKKRSVCCAPKISNFCPVGKGCNSTIIMTLDQYEAIRLIDYEKLTQEECATQMEIARATVQSIYEEARSIIARCLVEGKSFVIEGGNISLCDKRIGCDKCYRICPHRHNKQSIVNIGGKGKMKIAVTYQEGLVFQHFGHTEQFKIYSVVDNKIIGSEIVNTNGVGHGDLVRFLLTQEVDTLICGGIGGDAQNALAEANIKVFGGASGNADEVVTSLLNNELVLSSESTCHRHDGEHTCGEHGCESHDDHKCEHNCK